jgi:hypothetical protein
MASSEALPMLLKQLRLLWESSWQARADLQLEKYLYCGNFLGNFGFVDLETIGFKGLPRKNVNYNEGDWHDHER